MTTLRRFPIRIVGESPAFVRDLPGHHLETGCAIELPLGLSPEAARALARDVARVLARYAEQHTTEAVVRVYLGRPSVVQRSDVQEGRG